MTVSYDCVAGYHLNYLTCGIAKFNLLLAQKMKVPFINLYDPAMENVKLPLLSVKLGEFTSQDIEALPAWIEFWTNAGGYALFLHGYDGTKPEDELVGKAKIVYCGNSALYEKLRPINNKLQSLWCPGTNMSSQLFEETDLKVFSFGMAHKLKTEKYYRLKELLEETGKSYSILLSTALHEGTSFDESFIEVFKEMQAIFEDRVYFLGYLSDQAVYNQLKKSDFFTAFFDGGLRANNTSVNAALEAGVAVITNLDEYSPKSLFHMKNIIDINQADSLQLNKSIVNDIRLAAREVGSGPLGWDTLVDHLNKGF